MTAPSTTRSPLYFALRRFADNRAAMVSGIILAVIILMAVFAPLISKTGYEDQDFLTRALSFPSREFWFGVDDLGRDFFTRIIYGARVSLTIGFVAAAFSVVIGIPLGAAAGYYGGRIDWGVMRLIELFSVVPPLLAAMLLGALTKGGFATIVLIAALFGWVQVCLLVRAQVKAFREKEFVRAAAALGATGGTAFGQTPARVLRVGHQKGWLSILKGRGTLEKRLAPLGVKVTWTEFNAGPVQLEALNVGSIDFGDVGEAPPIFAQAAGAPLVYAGATVPRVTTATCGWNWRAEYCTDFRKEKRVLRIYP